MGLGLTVPHTLPQTRWEAHSVPRASPTVAGRCRGVRPRCGDVRPAIPTVKTKPPCAARHIGGDAKSDPERFKHNVREVRGAVRHKGRLCALSHRHLFTTTVV
jgi:hypothetical protein